MEVTTFTTGAKYSISISKIKQYYITEENKTKQKCFKTLKPANYFLIGVMYSVVTEAEEDEEMRKEEEEKKGNDTIVLGNDRVMGTLTYLIHFISYKGVFKL